MPSAAATASTLPRCSSWSRGSAITIASGRRGSTSSAATSTRWPNERRDRVDDRRLRTAGHVLRPVDDAPPAHVPAPDRAGVGGGDDERAPRRVDDAALQGRPGAGRPVGFSFGGPANQLMEGVVAELRPPGGGESAAVDYLFDN